MTRTQVRIVLALGIAMVVGGLVIGVVAAASASATGANPSQAFTGALALAAAGFALVYGAARRVGATPQPPAPAMAPEPRSSRQNTVTPRGGSAEPRALPETTRWVATTLLAVLAMALIGQATTSEGADAAFRLVSGLGLAGGVSYLVTSALVSAPDDGPEEPAEARQLVAASR